MQAGVHSPGGLGTLSEGGQLEWGQGEGCEGEGRPRGQKVSWETLRARTSFDLDHVPGMGCGKRKLCLAIVKKNEVMGQESSQ